MKSSLVCFLLDCFEQLEQRLPRNKAIFQGLAFLSSSVFLNQVGPKVPLAQLPMAHLRKNNADGIEEQYRKINLMNSRMEFNG